MEFELSGRKLYVAPVVGRLAILVSWVQVESKYSSTRRWLVTSVPCPFIQKERVSGVENVSVIITSLDESSLIEGEAVP